MAPGIFCIRLVVFISLLFPSISHAQVVINEFSPKSNPEWIEFYNASSSAEYIKSYYIDDDPNFTSDSGNSSRRPLEDLVTDNSTYPLFEIDSFLNNDHDWVVLFDSAGTIIDQYEYTMNSQTTETIGRSPDNSGSFSILSTASKGGLNGAPKPSPAPTDSPTPKPNATPKATPNATATPHASAQATPILARASPRPTPRKTNPSPSTEAEVLGETVTNTDPSPSVSPSASPKPGSIAAPVGVMLMIAGVGLSGAGGFLAYRQVIKKEA